MTEPLSVDFDHVRRSGARLVEYGRDLSDLVHRLQTETAAGPRWAPEAGGDSFTSAFMALTEEALGKADLLARDLEDLGLDLRIIADDLEASDERAEAAMRKVRKDL